MSANPYVEPRCEWDERYADLVIGKRNWQLAAGGRLAATLILAIAIVSGDAEPIHSVHHRSRQARGYALTAPQPLSASERRMRRPGSSATRS